MQVSFVGDGHAFHDKDKCFADAAHLRRQHLTSLPLVFQLRRQFNGLSDATACLHLGLASFSRNLQSRTRSLPHPLARPLSLPLSTPIGTLESQAAHSRLVLSANGTPGSG